MVQDGEEGTRTNPTIDEAVKDMVASLRECLHLPPKGVKKEPQLPTTTKRKKRKAPASMPEPSIPTPSLSLSNYEIENSVEETKIESPAIQKQQQKEIFGGGSHGNLSTAMVEAIRASIQSSKTFDSRSRLCELNLDTVLSSTSYRNLMRQTFGADGSILPGNENIKTNIIRVPTITRVFEVLFNVFL